MGLNQQASLLPAVLPRPEVDTWIETWPSIRNDFAADSEACPSFWSSAAALRVLLPTKPARNTDQSTAAALIHRAERDLRDLFLNSHAEVLYDNLTVSRAKFLRVDMAVERALLLKDKDGLEIDHGSCCHMYSHGQSADDTCATPCRQHGAVWSIIQRGR